MGETYWDLERVGLTPATVATISDHWLIADRASKQTCVPKVWEWRWRRINHSIFSE
jgi:hypothetical protein